MAGILSASRSSSSLITGSITTLSQAQARSVDAHLVQFAHLEIVNTLIASAATASARRAQKERFVQADLGLSEATRATTALGKKVDTKGEEDEEVLNRLDEIGFKVGWALVESLAKDKPRFPAAPPPSLSSSTTPQAVPSESHILDLVKFICKDVWIALYDKQVDNLRTNHRGVYVLVDNAFAPLAKVSSVKGEREAEEQVQRFVRFYLAFPSGVIRGALANLGVTCTVTAESAAVPQSTFQIKTIKTGAVV